MESRKIIGIDLGTTNSCVAVWEGTGVTVIENLEGKKTTPSVVSFTQSGKKIGDHAKRQAAMYPELTIRSVKRLMGEPYSSVKDSLDQFSYHVVKGRNGKAAISLENSIMLPQQVSAHILGYLKACAENYLGETVTDAVITVPAYFSEPQRQATKEAARIAGLNVRRLLNEPTAAALAYSLSGTRLGRILVFDLGGGTFDVSILDCSENVYDVIATGGKIRLGGDDIDILLAKDLEEDFLMQCEPGITLAPEQMMRLREAAEEAKIALSSERTTDVSLTWLAPESKKSPHLIRTISRDMLEGMASQLICQCEEICRRTIEEADVEISGIDHVLLVGGSTKMPAIRSMVERLFGKHPSALQDADQIVAVGAAVEGAILSGAIHDRHLLDVTPLALGVMTQGRNFDVVIEPNTSIPTSRSILYEGVSSSQQAVSIIVVQGKNAYDSHMKRIGDFDIFGIMASDSGVPVVEVTFDIDHNGLLTVSAKDMKSGRKGQTRIENACDLSEGEIRDMQEELSSDMEKGVSLADMIRQTRPEDPSSLQ